MKLEKIKLVGFKSFPDQVTIDILSNVTAIVGPNGCGKSNIVDAVSWALGHDAREVRAAYADDVIFSGTSARKAMGLAAVELLFDNTDNTAGGQYASYNQISIRRNVDRNRESRYFINNTRCRRRDIHDIFANTGLGTHGYAIIEQGMISRIIEAKPDEMRLYIEEVAGISKYRDRKRDAEIRMRHTHENLARVRDIREEIDKQLRKLKRQAGDAKRFQKLKNEQHELSIRVLILEYRQYDEQRLHHERQLSELRLKLESNQTEITSSETQMQELRLAQDEWNEKLNQTRERFYALNAEIAGVEQDIATRRKNAEQLSQEQEAIEQAMQKCDARDQAQEQRQVQLQQKLQTAEQDIVRANDKMAAYQRQLNHAEQEQSKLRSEWDSHHSSGKEVLDNVKVYRVKIDYCAKELDNIQSRMSEITERRAAIQPNTKKAKLAQEQNELQTLQRILSAHEQGIRDLIDEATQLQFQIDGTLKDTHEASIHVQNLRGRLASLKALQEEATEQVPEGFTDWLQKNNLSDVKKVVDYLEVEVGWEKAVEQVLGYMLSGMEVGMLDTYIKTSSEIKAGRLMMIESSTPPADIPQDSLATKIKNSTAIQVLLAHVYIADGLESAMQRRSRLASHESLITAAGLWLGKHWMQLHRNYEQNGMLSRRREIEQLQIEITTADKKVNDLQMQTSSLRDLLQGCEEAREQIRLKLQTCMNDISDIKLQMQQTEIKIKQENDLMQNLDNELSRLSERETNMHKQSDALQKDYEQATVLASGHDSSGSALEQKRLASEATVAETRNQISEQQRQLHEIEIEQQSLITELKGLDEASEQNRQQHTDLIHRREAMHEATQNSREPIAQRQAEIQGLINQREELEATISECNTTLKEDQSQIRELEAQHKSLHEVRENMQAQHQQLHGSHQAAVVRCNDLRQKLSEVDSAPEQFVDSEEAEDVTQARDTLEKVEQKISRMGSINLIAIEEFEELSERKSYLDDQNQDLVSALESIQQAINKIDRESKEKFKNTFEQINDKLYAIFKRLFNGGYARLELIEQNWLESGVSIMVYPPGKKLSSIRLLSGGEKALSALAVVFAIFELRPAPFCILDEVDAPLDENNILNFCRLINDMSEKVQFMIITHSRLTMESVNALVGVTMAEPGISRLVSVNVEEAVQIVSG